MKRNIVIILCIILLISVLIVNGLANALPLNNKTTAELSDSLPNLFVPAGITFAIWGVIYLLLLIFTSYQAVPLFKNKNEPDYMLKVRILFMISCILNISWIFTWHYEFIFLSWIVMLGLLTVLIFIYQEIYSHKDTLSKREHIFVRLPFSIYLGWITVAAIANTTVLLVTLNWDRFGFTESFWTVIIIGTAAVIGIMNMITKKDWAYNSVLIWAFAGIIIKRSNPVFSPQPEIILASYISIGAILISTIIIKLLKIRIE